MTKVSMCGQHSGRMSGVVGGWVTNYDSTGIASHVRSELFLMFLESDDKHQKNGGSVSSSSK